RVRRWLPCELQILPEIFGEVGAAERALSIREERICRRWLTTNPKLPAILEPLLERRPRALVERDGASPVVVLRLAELRSATAALAVFGAQLERLVHLETWIGTVQVEHIGHARPSELAVSCSRAGRDRVPHGTTQLHLLAFDERLHNRL